jgi:hypothetical protein
VANGKGLLRSSQGRSQAQTALLRGTLQGMNLTPEPNVTRFEVIDETGRAYVRRQVEIELNYQDDGRTLKVFVRAK